MELWMWIAVLGGAAAAIVIVVAAAAVMRRSRKRRSDHLRDEFGGEYERAVASRGRRDAESELEERNTRARQLSIRPLSINEATRFSGSWESIQAQFIDFPVESVLRADRLVAEVLQTRGYPAIAFEDRVAVLSVDHPRASMQYRAGRDIALRSQRTTVSTEDLRHAMMHYRAVFQEMLDIGADHEEVEQAAVDSKTEAAAG